MPARDHDALTSLSRDVAPSPGHGAALFQAVGQRSTPLLFTLTSLLSAALLFLIQPMVARMVLPQFGGSPAVWTTCMLFFQVLLLAGYGYAHLAWRAGGKKQAAAHLLLMIAALAVLPISVTNAWAPRNGQEPRLLLLGLLFCSAGLPFFVLASSSPLLQCWYATSDCGPARDPYWLYAASNLGSMAGLAGYPLLMEPFLTVRAQSALWTAGFALLVVLFGACAANVAWSTAGGHKPGEPALAEQPPSLSRRTRWIALAFVPSSLMLGVTAHLTTDVPPVPMLWIVPLGLYLLTFVLSFSPMPFPPRSWVVRLMCPAIVLSAYLLIDSSPPYAGLCGVLFCSFFLISLGFHGELARDRPQAAYLTLFYVCLATGGAMGGVFNSLVAPRLFSWVAELPLSLIMAAFLLPVLRPVRRDRATRVLDLVIPAALGGAATLPTLGELRHALPMALCLLLPARPLRLGLGLALILAAWHVSVEARDQLIHRERSFFGVLRIVRGRPLDHRLFHGFVCHGAQNMSTDPRIRNRPLLYFYPSGPIGQVFRDFLGSRPARPVGLVGLGAGSLASYGARGQELSFFEIDPAVARLASDERYFTFLRDSAARCRTVIGDARLTLQEEPDHRFGLIVIDAFSGDSIPVHLLTREALRIYLSKLADDGLIALHITNSFMDIEPLIGALAQSESVVARVRNDSHVTAAEARQGKEASLWAVVARKVQDLGPLAADPRWRPTRIKPGLVAWTDDFANPLALLNWR